MSKSKPGVCGPFAPSGQPAQTKCAYPKTKTASCHQASCQQNPPSTSTPNYPPKSLLTHIPSTYQGHKTLKRGKLSVVAGRRRRQLENSDYTMTWNCTAKPQRRLTQQSRLIRLGCLMKISVIPQRDLQRNLLGNHQTIKPTLKPRSHTT